MMKVTCGLCGKTAEFASYDDVVDSDWELEFWWTESVVGQGEACGQCSHDRLTGFPDIPLVKPEFLHLMPSSVLSPLSS